MKIFFVKLRKNDVGETAGLELTFGQSIVDEDFINKRNTYKKKVGLLFKYSRHICFFFIIIIVCPLGFSVTEKTAIVCVHTILD